MPLWRQPLSALARLRSACPPLPSPRDASSVRCCRAPTAADAEAGTEVRVSQAAPYQAWEDGGRAGQVSFEDSRGHALVTTLRPISPLPLPTRPSGGASRTPPGADRGDSQRALGFPGYASFDDLGDASFRGGDAGHGESIWSRQGQVSFSDLAMAEYAAVRVAATKPQPLPERLVGRYPRAVRSWRMVVLRYNAWRRANTMAKRRIAAAGEAGQASALVCNTVFAVAAFWALCSITAAPRGVGVAAAACRLCQVCCLVYAVGMPTRPQRAAAIIAVIPLMDPATDAAQAALRLPTKQQVFQLLRVACVLLCICYAAIILARWA